MTLPSLRRTFIATALVFASALIAGCGAESPDASTDRPAAGHPTGEHEAAGHGPTDHQAADRAAADHTATEHRALEADAPADFSIYHSETVWTDQDGRTLELAELRGRVQVVAMLYTNCAYACPRLMVDMKRIEAELGPEYRDDVGFVVVSIDPERDTPEQLARFARGSRLDPDRWTLLHGGEGDIRELAVLLGVRYRQAAPGEWVHSNLITVLDRDGVVVHRQLGLGTDPGETLGVIRSE